MSEFQTICQIRDIPEGESRMFLVDGTRLAIFHLGGEFFALDDCCPHAGASLALGVIEGETVSCRIHHWRFSIPDGTYLDEPKSKCNVTSYPIRIVGDNVEIGLPPKQHED